MEHRIKHILKTKHMKIISMESTVDFKINFQFQSAETVKVEAQEINNIIIYKSLLSAQFFAGISKSGFLSWKNLNII